MRIAFVTSIFPQPGKPYRGTYNYKLAQSLQKLTDIEVFSPFTTIPRPGALRAQSGYTTDRLGTGTPVERVTFIPYPSIPFLTRSLNGLACSQRLLPFLEKSRPDLVFAPWIHPDGYAAVRACEKIGIPVITCALGSDLRRVPDPVSRWLVRQTMKRSTAVVTVSRELKEWAVKYGAAPGNVFPVLNGCDMTVFHPRDRAEMRRKWKVEPDAELALFVGWITHTKGIRELMDAAESLFERRPRMRLALIGDGDMRDWLKQRVAGSAWRDRFLVLGHKTAWEIAEWVAASNYLCLPSYSEGCPNVVIEALAGGRPVVGTNVGGIPELLNETTGIIIPARDTAKLAQALNEAFDRPWDEQHIHRTAGRSWDQVAVEILAICQTTFERARPPARSNYGSDSNNSQ